MDILCRRTALYCNPQVFRDFPFSCRKFKWPTCVLDLRPESAIALPSSRTRDHEPCLRFGYRTGEGCSARGGRRLRLQGEVLVLALEQGLDHGLLLRVHPGRLDDALEARRDLLEVRAHALALHEGLAALQHDEGTVQRVNLHDTSTS